MNVNFNRYLLFAGSCLSFASLIHILQMILKIFGDKKNCNKKDTKEKEIKYWFSEINKEINKNK